MVSWRFRRIVQPLIGLAMLVALLPLASGAGAASGALYARPTGHTIPAAFRALWESTGGADGLGWPLAEATTTNGVTEQWFAAGRIFQRASGAPELAAVGREMATSRSLLSTAAFKPLPQPTGPTLAGWQYVAKTGHWVANGFFTLWTAKKALLGDPISEEFTEDGATTQYFMNGRLTLDPEANAPRVTLLGIVVHGSAEAAVTAPQGVEQVGVAPLRDIQGVTPREGRWVLVNIAQQRLYAYEGTQLVQETLVSTGIAAYPSPTGSFWVQQRVRSQRMVGPGYNLPNVPFIQYFGNDQLSWQEGYALHGTYWHNNFGTPQSHGCINLTVDFAEWLWGWSGDALPVEIIAG